MTVVDRYLKAVCIFLPRSVQRDIIAELSDDIRSRIEDREGALGRPLTDSEQEAIIAEFGHPALLAGRYGPRRHLVGPEIFPFYVLVLKLALGVAATVQVGVTVAMFVGGHTSQAIRQATVVLPLVAFVQFAVITLVFAALDAYGVLERFGHRWMPQMPERPEPPTVTYHIVHIVMTALFAAWWLTALREPFLVFGPAAVAIKPAPIWASLYVPMLLLAVTDIVLRIVAVVRPQWPRAIGLVRVALNGLSLALLYVLMRAGEWVVVVDANHARATVEFAVEMLNKSVPWVFASAAIAMVVAMAREVLAIRNLERSA
jgi:hypothetical protein